MSLWSLEPIFDSYLAVAVVALALTLLLLLRPTYRALSQAQWGTLLGLRCATILLLLMAMLGPTHVSTTSEPQTAVVIVLADKSRSMQLPDGASASPSRWEAQQKVLQQVEPLLAK